MLQIAELSVTFLLFACLLTLLLLAGFACMVMRSDACPPPPLVLNNMWVKMTVYHQIMINL